MNKLRCQSITIFNRWGTALSQDQTLIWVLRRELKGWFTAEYFWRATRCLILWFNTVSSVWYCFSIKVKKKKQWRHALIWRLFPLYFLYKSLTTLRSNHLQFPRELLLHSLSPNRTVAHHKVRLPHFILQEYQKRNSPLNVGIFQNTTPETTIHQRQTTATRQLHSFLIQSM